MDKKELALAVNFSKAPKELQDAVKAADALNRKVAAAEAKRSAAWKEVKGLQKQADEANAAAAALLAAWDGEVKA